MLSKFDLVSIKPEYHHQYNFNPAGIMGIVLKFEDRYVTADFVTMGRTYTIDIHIDHCFVEHITTGVVDSEPRQVEEHEYRAIEDTKILRGVLSAII